MLTIILCVITAACAFYLGRVTAPRLPKRDAKGRFLPTKRKKEKVRRPLTLPDVGPQHLAVLSAAVLGIGLASLCPAALAPFAALAPLPLGVAWGRDIITPKKSNQSWSHLPLSAAWDPAEKMWEDWYEEQ